jgi:hypothetical protein
MTEPSQQEFNTKLDILRAENEQLNTISELYIKSHCQNLVLTILFIINSLDSG